MGTGAHGGGGWQSAAPMMFDFNEHAHKIELNRAKTVECSSLPAT